MSPCMIFDWTIDALGVTRLDNILTHVVVTAHALVRPGDAGRIEGYGYQLVDW